MSGYGLTYDKVAPKVPKPMRRREKPLSLQARLDLKAARAEARRLENAAAMRRVAAACLPHPGTAPDQAARNKQETPRFAEREVSTDRPLDASGDNGGCSRNGRA